MTESTTRRTYLLAVLRNLHETVTTKLALEIYATSPWRTASRNTARRDLRDLARRAYLVPVEIDGARAYTLGVVTDPPHPRRGSLRNQLLAEIQQQGGEWTTGRVKATCRRILGTHFYRPAARHLLVNLHWLGHLDRHGDDTPRRFYTLAEDTR